jgi:hypothetical protein
MVTHQMLATLRNDSALEGAAVLVLRRPTELVPSANAVTSVLSWNDGESAPLSVLDVAPSPPSRRLLAACAPSDMTCPAGYYCDAGGSVVLVEPGYYSAADNCTRLPCANAQAPNAELWPGQNSSVCRQTCVSGFYLAPTLVCTRAGLGFYSPQYDNARYVWYAAQQCLAGRAPALQCAA